MSRRLATALVAVLMLSQLSVAEGGARQAAAKAGVDGNAYENPTFGWTISWDETWVVEAEDETDDGDLLELTDNLSFVYFESYEGYDGDPEACIDDEQEYLSSLDGFSNVEL